MEKNENDYSTLLQKTAYTLKTPFVFVFSELLIWQVHGGRSQSMELLTITFDLLPRPKTLTYIAIELIEPNKSGFKPMISELL